MAKYLIYCLLFILPLVILPFGISYFETPKVILTEVIIEILLLYLFFKNSSFSFKKINRIFLICIISIFVLSLVHLIFLRTSTTFFGNAFRLQGIFLLWHLLIFSLISSKFKLDDISSIKYFIPAFLAFLSTFFFGTDKSGRFFGSLGEPNALAATAIFIWPFLFFLPKSSFFSKSITKILIFLMVMILIFFSGSRSGLVAFILQVIFILFHFVVKLPLKKTLLIILIMYLLSLSLTFLQKNRVFENRSEIWQTAFIAGFQKPIIGSGFGNIESNLAQTAEKLKNNIRYQYVDSSHNLLLDWWIQAGIFGVLIIGLFLIKVFQSFLIQEKKRELVLLIGVLTTMSFNPVSVTTLVAFWWLVGQGFSEKS